MLHALRTAGEAMSQAKVMSMANYAKGTVSKGLALLVDKGLAKVEFAADGNTREWWAA